MENNVTIFYYTIRDKVPVEDFTVLISTSTDLNIY